MADLDFTFPDLSKNSKAPLTAYATVTDVSQSGARTQPANMTSDPKANLEHRNKDDPFLTRVVYKLLAWIDHVPLEKGYSQVDWLRLTRSNPGLNGLQGKPLRKDITMEEVKQHRTKDDAWMVLRGKVYNITPYLKFHPGGPDILMKAAGRDGYAMFMKYHPWVNVDALLEKCLVGFLLQDPKAVPPAGAAAGQQQQESPLASTAGSCASSSHNSLSSLASPGEAAAEEGSSVRGGHAGAPGLGSSPVHGTLLSGLPAASGAQASSSKDAAEALGRQLQQQHVSPQPNR